MVRCQDAFCPVAVEKPSPGQQAGAEWAAQPTGPAGLAFRPPPECTLPNIMECPTRDDVRGRMALPRPTPPPPSAGACPEAGLLGLLLPLLLVRRPLELPHQHHRRHEVRGQLHLGGPPPNAVAGNLGFEKGWERGRAGGGGGDDRLAEREQMCKGATLAVGGSVSMAWVPNRF